MITIYTDGGCSGNPGPGGWGMAVIHNNCVIKTKQGTDNYTTNNRMELTALIEAFKTVEKLRAAGIENQIIIYSDSAYCVNAYNSWINNWAVNGWKNSKGKEVENINLMKLLYYYNNKNFSKCQLCKIKGHDNVLGNELADALATNNTSKINKILSSFVVL